jgi:hypothetical protein
MEDILGSVDARAAATPSWRTAARKTMLVLTPGTMRRGGATFVTAVVFPTDSRRPPSRMGFDPVPRAAAPQR